MKDIRYPQVLDIDGRLVAILNKAYKISYNKVKNGLWTASFTLPLNDSKVAGVLPKYHIEIFDHDKRIGRFIVNPKRTIKNESTKEVTFNCEHVLSTLHSSILFRYHQYTNLITDDVIAGLLQNQRVKHWKLGSVEMSRYFSYSWENEDSLLNAIMSVTKPFDIPFLWTWDDENYPFTLNLVNPPDDVKDVIVAGKNLKGIELEEDPTSIITRIFPLGAGEGVNQLTIEKVNGFPYLDDPQAEAEYGIHERVWVDKTSENANTLMSNAQAILDKYKVPIISCSIDAIDYYLKDKYNFDSYTTGDMLQVFNEDTSTNKLLRVEKLSKPDVYGQPDAISLELGNRVADIGMTWSDLQKKQLINDTYSQGATNIDSRDFVGECDQSYPAVLRFYIPEDVVNINSMLLTFETQKYRAYSKAVEGGGATVIGATSTSGGSVSSSVKSSSSGGVHRHRMLDWVDQPGGSPTLPLNGYLAASNLAGDAAFRFVELYSDAGDLYTAGASDAHFHTTTLPATPGHTHDTEINIPNHVHPLKHGIYEYSTLPTSITIKVDGTSVPISGISGDNIDLLPYLRKDGSGNVSRGRYAEIVITPNDLARINVTVTSRLFVQSRLGGQY